MGIFGLSKRELANRNGDLIEHNLDLRDEVERLRALNNHQKQVRIQQEQEAAIVNEQQAQRIRELELECDQLSDTASYLDASLDAIKVVCNMPPGRAVRVVPLVESIQTQ